jgi:hypothetical protein
MPKVQVEVVGKKGYVDITTQVIDAKFLLRFCQRRTGDFCLPNDSESFIPCEPSSDRCSLCGAFIDLRRNPEAKKHLRPLKFIDVPVVNSDGSPLSGENLTQTLTPDELRRQCPNAVTKGYWPFKRTWCDRGCGLYVCNPGDTRWCFDPKIPFSEPGTKM